MSTATHEDLIGIVNRVVALDVMITNLYNSPGTHSPTDTDALAKIKEASAAIVEKIANIAANPPVMAPIGQPGYALDETGAPIYPTNDPRYRASTAKPVYVEDPVTKEVTVK